MQQKERIRTLTETIGEKDEVARIRQLIGEHRWIFAKTYASFCPHEYTLRKDWAEDAEYRSLGNFIWSNGAEAYYGRKTVPNRYWFDHESGWYYFVFPDDTDEEGTINNQSILINRARICDFDFWKDESRGIIRCAARRN